MARSTVIVEKIKRLISDKSIKPEEILALTFTEKAAAEMEERVDKVIPYGYTQSWISTFHSFADTVLRRETARIGLNPNYKLMTTAENIIFFRSHLFDFPLSTLRPLGNPNKFIEAMLQHFSRLKDENISPEEYLNWANSIQNKLEIDDVEKSQALELAQAYAFYQEIKIKEGMFDFSDLIYYVIQVFKQRPGILARYRQQFSYILVDEFQDTNIAQYELIKMLCPPGTRTNLTVVGDDSQAIYKFRGASVSNIMAFMHDYPQAKQITLIRNYRSHQSILDASYKLILKIFDIAQTHNLTFIFPRHEVVAVAF
jgi:DNA helicase-2/ATP-dependent DNA helicase PcrA